MAGTAACRDRLGVSAIRFHHAGESSLILKDYVQGLPDCIGCNSCVNVCPTGALEMRDLNDERLILMSGTVINRIKMEKCEGCGVHYVPKVLVKHVAKLVDAPEEAFEKKFCPQCKRISRAARIAGMEPDYSGVDKSEVQVY